MFVFREGDFLQRDIMFHAHPPYPLYLYTDIHCLQLMNRLDVTIRCLYSLSTNYRILQCIFTVEQYHVL